MALRKWNMQSNWKVGSQIRKSTHCSNQDLTTPSRIVYSNYMKVVWVWSLWNVGVER
jgi:hypothetical protein